MFVSDGDVAGLSLQADSPRDVRDGDLVLVRRLRSEAVESSAAIARLKAEVERLKIEHAANMPQLPTADTKGLGQEAEEEEAVALAAALVESRKHVARLESEAEKTAAATVSYKESIKKLHQQMADQMAAMGVEVEEHAEAKKALAKERDTLLQLLDQAEAAGEAAEARAAEAAELAEAVSGLYLYRPYHATPP